MKDDPLAYCWNCDAAHIPEVDPTPSADIDVPYLCAKCVEQAQYQIEYQIKIDASERLKRIKEK